MVGTGTDPCQVSQQQSGGPELPFMHSLEVQAIDYCLTLFHEPVSALEWGSGNSTLYFSSKLPKGSSWCAVEHNRAWAEKVAKQLEESRRVEISLTYIPPQGWCEGQGDGDRSTFGSYIDFPATLHRRFQVIFVDGRARVECMRAAWPLLDESGVMILHDAQRQAYDPGIPADCFSVRMINPREYLEGNPLAVLFMSKSPEVLKALVQGLRQRLPDYLLLELSAQLKDVQTDRSMPSDLMHRTAAGFNKDSRSAEMADEDLLPVHFFTIVLNGEPFIRHHLETFTQLPFRWHWHIIEGVAEHKHDTAWTLAYGGRITDSLHKNGLSNDGTTAYLDEIAAAYPQQVTIYRKPSGMLWDGKLEMVQAPLKNITRESLLWQVDVDEFWSAEQVSTARRLFLEQPERTAAFYWCYFFVGPDKLVSTRNCYSQNPAYEWLRTWRFRPGMRWGAHSPPILLAEDQRGNVHDVGKDNPFLHHETEQAGLVFYHYAYTLETQLRFKEIYYGYADAVAGWQRLQEARTFPVRLRDYFAWVSDDTQVDTVQHLAIPCLRAFPWLAPPAPRQKSGLTVLVDGIFFQFRSTGIARVWHNLLSQWSRSDFAASVILLDRDGTAPAIPNITTVTIPAFHPLYAEEDRRMLQRCCDAAGADIFISTYYTVPQTTPSVFMAHDMIPENTSFFDLNEPMWQLKHYGIAHASAYIAVSRNTALDLVRFHPAAADTLTIAYNGIDTACFYRACPEEIACFRRDYAVEKPYFIYVGDRTGYKNGWLFFAGLAALPSRGAYEVVCIGGNPTLEPEFAALVPDVRIHILALPDAQLRAAYSGAVAFVYPSLYEGFGLPILEAMACDCPVITCQTSSIPEVAGAAALYVEPGKPEQMAEALQQVQDEAIRLFLVHRGRQQLKRFSWAGMAAAVRKVLEDTVAKAK